MKTKSSSGVNLTLHRRNYGVHQLLKEVELPNTIEHYCNIKEERVFEENLLNDIPKGWLPEKPSNIVLGIQNKNKLGGTFMRDLNVFKDFSKYYDCYSLSIKY